MIMCLIATKDIDR